jgi:hypothetical protein
MALVWFFLEGGGDTDKCLPRNPSIGLHKVCISFYIVSYSLPLTLEITRYVQHDMSVIQTSNYGMFQTSKYVHGVLNPGMFECLALFFTSRIKGSIMYLLQSSTTAIFKY